MQNVRDYGAVGDGKTLDTAAIQSAIDAGGEVYFPSGVYRTGTLYLKSHGGLRLGAGAVLLASTERADYNADDFCEQNAVFASEFVTGAHLIVAVEREDIFICGEGTIDGNGRYWMNETKRSGESRICAPNAERIAQMLFLCECQNVRISGVTLRNAPYWHLFLHGCEDVQLHGLRIFGNRLQYTNDGIDLDCCRRVTVSDCIIETGDDAITLRANDKRLKTKRACEDITVTNCVLSSYCDYAIRVGVGAGTIRNCLFSNLRIRESNIGIGFTAYFALYRSGMAASIENLRFDNLLIDAGRPIEIRVASQDDCPPALNYAYLRDIDFRGVYARGSRNNKIYGFENSKLSDIRFSDCRFVCTGNGGISNPTDELGRHDRQTDDSLFMLRDAENIEFRACRFEFSPDVSGWEHTLSGVRCKNVRTVDCEMTKDTDIRMDQPT